MYGHPHASDGDERVCTVSPLYGVTMEQHGEVMMIMSQNTKNEHRWSGEKMVDIDKEKEKKKS